jgi:hypothetical protein
MFLLLTQILFFPEIPLFLQLSLVDLCGVNRAFLPLENYDFPEVFHSKTNSILTVKQGVRFSCFEQENTLRDTCVLTLAA